MVRFVRAITAGWRRNGETPVGEGARRDPTVSETSEVARQFPHRKANRFPATLILLWQRTFVTI